MNAGLELAPRHRGRVPLAGNALAVMRDPIEFQRRGHARYGPVFQAKVFSEQLHFVDPLGAPELLEQVVRAPVEELSMIDAYKQLLGRIIGPELFIEVDKALRDGLSVKYIRRHLGPTARFVPDELARHVEGDRGELDGLMLANDYVFHVAAHYVLGPEATRRCGAELARLIHLLESDFSVVGMMLPIETPSARRRTAAFSRLLELTDIEVRRRLEHRGDHDDFLNYAIENLIEDPSRCSEADRKLLVLRCLGVIFGAHTNTAMTVAAAMQDLLQHPEVMAGVMAEVDALAQGATLDVAGLRGLERLHQAITETLRLRSTGGIWRKTRRALNLGRFQLAPGSLIGTTMGLVNLDPARYPQPHRYRPARYTTLKTDGYQSPSVTSTPLQFGAFGTGRGLCSGRPLAYAMAGLILVELLRRFEWTLLAQPKRWFPVLTGGLGRPVGALTLGYRRR